MGTHQGEPRLIEREHELAVLGGAVEAAVAGHGRVVVVEGPAGIGKSRLLAAARAHAAAAGLRVLGARGGELERDFAFGVARQLFEPAVAELDLSGRSAVLAGAARLAAPVVDLADEAAPPVAGDRLFAVTHGLHWLCANLAVRQPLLLAVDDAQWADEQSLRFLAYVARRLAAVPVCLVVAAREEHDPVCGEVLAALADEPVAVPLRPAGLSADAVGAVVGELLGVTPDAAVVAACHRRSAGNPFVVRELATALAGAGLAADDPAHVREVDRVLPRSVARSVLDRLRPLSEGAVGLAVALAVLGDDTALVDAARLAGLDDDAAADACDVLTGAGLLAAGMPLRVTHPLVREAIYEDLTPARRLVLHRRAAEVLPARVAPERIAAHLLACEPHGDPASVAVLRRCAARAMDRGAPRAAARYLQRALAEGPPAEELPGLLRALGAAEARTGLPEAVVHLEEAMALAERPADAAATARELGIALGALGRMADAVSALERGIAMLDGRDRELALRLEGELGAFGQLDTVSSGRVGRRLHRAAPGLTGSTPGERLVLASYAHLRSNELADADELARLAGLALGDGRLLEDQTADSAAFYLLAHVLFRAERHAECERWLAAALEEARERGSLLGTTIALGVRALFRLHRGELVDAESDARTSADAQLEHGWASVLPIAVAALSDCVLEREGPAAAAALFAEVGLDGDLPQLQAFVWAQAARGRARVGAGDVEAGLADLLACDLAVLGPRPSVALHWRADAALALAARGEGTAGRTLATEHVALARQAAVPRPLGIGLRALGLLTPGADGLALLEEAVAVLAPSSARFEHARALVDLGGALRRAGQRSAARERLRAGYDAARRCGGVQLAARARDELAASGVRLRRPDLSGADALTPSERRVAELAADGMSNPQIAQALFVTRKTVEMHLGRVYRKLGVRGREALRTALAPQTTQPV